MWLCWGAHRPGGGVSWAGMILAWADRAIFLVGLFHVSSAGPA